jgi:hypothetical protein
MVNGVQHIGKMLITLGIVIAAIGGIFLFLGKISWPGKIPGDILIQRKNFTFFFPLATSILISIFLSLLFWIFRGK